MENPDPNDRVLDKLIEEEYRIWKKNSPFLYDFVITHALDWPSLTVQWLPFEESRSASGSDVITQKLVLGTQSDESSEAEANYLMIADVSENFN
jgi:histone-binding protein RBBP4